MGNEQLTILYADMVSEGDLGFNLPVFLVMPHDMDTARLQWALAQLVERHGPCARPSATLRQSVRP